jgi:hypothetical protein
MTHRPIFLGLPTGQVPDVPDEPPDVVECCRARDCEHYGSACADCQENDGAGEDRDDGDRAFDAWRDEHSAQTKGDNLC